MSSKIQQTREKFSGRIGEIIEAALGIGDLKALFEAAEQGDVEATARINAAGISGEAPSGMLALKMGLIDRETKNALLTAQAAEQTLRIIEEIENFYSIQVPTVEKTLSEIQFEPGIRVLMNSPYAEPVTEYFESNVSKAPTKIPSFAFIGSKGDPDFLICAQATHQLAAEYEHNEKQGMKEKLIRQYMKVPDAQPFNSLYINGFKTHAAQSYQTAGAILTEKGFTELADDISAVAQSYEAVKDFQNTPENFSKNLVFNQNRSVMTINAMLDPMGDREMPYVSVNDEWENLITMRGKQSLKCA